MYRLKRAFYYLGLLIGLAALLMTTISISFTQTISTEGFQLILNYAAEFGLDEVNNDAGLIFVMIEISKHSHLIITVNLILIVIFVFLLVTDKSGRKKRNER